MPFVILALMFSTAAAAGSVYLSLGMGLKACTLCFYERAFAFGLVAVLAVGLLTFRDRPGRLCLLGTPLAMAGFCVAAFHVLLGMSGWPRTNATWYLACPRGIGGLGTAPEQSLAAFTLTLLVLLLGGVQEVRKAKQGAAALFAAWALGVCLAFGSLTANPQMASPRATDGKPLDTCRPTLR